MCRFISTLNHKLWGQVCHLSSLRSDEECDRHVEIYAPLSCVGRTPATSVGGGPRYRRHLCGMSRRLCQPRKERLDFSPMSVELKMECLSHPSPQTPRVKNSPAVERGNCSQGLWRSGRSEPWPWVWMLRAAGRVTGGDGREGVEEAVPARALRLRGSLGRFLFQTARLWLVLAFSCV